MDNNQVKIIINDIFKNVSYNETYTKVCNRFNADYPIIYNIVKSFHHTVKNINDERLLDVVIMAFEGGPQAARYETVKALFNQNLLIVYKHALVLKENIQAV
jgi:hypothetical protein